MSAINRFSPNCCPAVTPSTTSGCLSPVFSDDFSTTLDTTYNILTVTTAHTTGGRFYMGASTTGGGVDDGAAYRLGCVLEYSTTGRADSYKVGATLYGQSSVGSTVYDFATIGVYHFRHFGSAQFSMFANGAGYSCGHPGGATVVSTSVNMTDGDQIEMQLTRSSTNQWDIVYKLNGSAVHTTTGVVYALPFGTTPGGEDEYGMLGTDMGTRLTSNARFDDFYVST